MQQRQTSWGPGWVLAVGVIAMLAAGRAGGAEPPILEWPDDPWMPARPPAAPGGVASVVLGEFQSIQVNIDGDDLNIPGDAANEPSITVDPTAPNRIAIGWRQFDTIQSNFRQAGRAYSVDGGRTWTFP
ncbi:MAG: hypothetical protein ACYTJ0_12575, partial [Planctomycetota bacterium]